MPLKHLRICTHCARIRFAGCGLACRVPIDSDKDSWLPNLQEGAGQLPWHEETI